MLVCAIHPRGTAPCVRDCTSRLILAHFASITSSSLDYLKSRSSNGGFGKSGGSWKA